MTNTIRWGISAMSHNAALAVFNNDNLVFAAEAERYSRIKNDKDLHPDLVAEALEFGEPDEVHFYENTRIKKRRQLFAGQYKSLLKQSPKSYLKKYGITAPIKMAKHHASHAAGGFYTGYLADAAILVIDSIGEYETLSIWQSTDQGIKQVWSQDYPHSVGLWYSAMTQRLGLKPQEHEYILMGMAALGDPGKYYDLIKNDFFMKMPDNTDPSVKFKMNLHKGCKNWRHDLNSVQDYTDIAAAVQQIYEEIFIGLLSWMSANLDQTDVVIAGGSALNCVANSLAYNYYDRVWISPAPGDSGSAIGAVLANVPMYIDLNDAYLGHNIEGEYPIQAIIDDLMRDGISAVASGRAEFGPRALGHRSILADPRIPDIKDRVNKIKQREEFRPFSPMILNEHAATHFKLPDVDWNAPYMQFAIPCLQPHKYPGIVHVDGTSRVQTVGKHTLYENKGPRRLLEAWHGLTGCPMLLNTSLNIKGQPLINTIDDVYQFVGQTLLPVRVPEGADNE